MMELMDVEEDILTTPIILMGNSCTYLCYNNNCDKLDGFTCCWDTDEIASLHCERFSPAITS